MTERKPPGISFESWIDKQVREATERGEFENLKGAGQPIPAGAADENWWLRNYLQREGASADGLLPESIILRRERERIYETVRDLLSEREVRTVVSALNDRIVEYLRMPSGPHVPIGPLKTDEVVATWRAEREATRAARRPAAAAPAEPQPTEQRWWQRFFGR
ncbi:DnaJ family domain-containing protein [Nocardia heshunensis]